MCIEEKGDKLHGISLSINVPFPAIIIDKER